MLLAYISIESKADNQWDEIKILIEHAYSKNGTALHACKYIRKFPMQILTQESGFIRK